VVYKETLGGGRLLKTFLCVHDDGGLVVVKVYLKREDSPDLQDYKAELVKLRETLTGLDCPHVWPFQTWFETNTKAFLLRQYIFSDLYERISTRPFLSFAEKKWIAFQLLQALVQTHEKGVYHGDIKCENILVTSWNWVYLSDFAAAYKPTFLPADNPADFSFYFDAGSRRRCYLAPERFIDRASSSTPNAQAQGSTPASGGEKKGMGGEFGEDGANTEALSSKVEDLDLSESSPQVFSPAQSQSRGGLTSAMDIFSLGCVLAELFMEGKSLFDLAELHAYRRGELDPEPLLTSKVQDVRVRNLILHMIQLDPEKRLTAQEYLASNKWMAIGDADERDAAEGFSSNSNNNAGGPGHVLFPKYMSQTLHDFYATLLPLDVEGRLSTVRLAYSQLKEYIAGTAGSGGNKKRSNNNELQGGKDGSGVYDQMKMRDEYTSKQRECLKEGMMILVSLFCSLLRNTKTPSSKCACIHLLCKSGMYCDDEIKLQHIVPYLVSMVNQGSTIVRSIALSALTSILESVEYLPDSEEKAFAEYIFPSLALLCSDAEEMVRVRFAMELPKLILVACRLLGIPMHQEKSGVENSKLGAENKDKDKEEETHTNHLLALKKEISRILIDLTTGSYSTSSTIQAIMQNFECFCLFFGVQETNNLLLPLFITFLNHSDWQVRRDFFKQLPLISRFTAPRNGFNNSKVLEAFLIPCVEQAFVDPEAEVVASSLACLCEIIEGKAGESRAYILEKSTLLNLVESAKSFLGLTQDSENQTHYLPSITKYNIVPLQVFVACVKFIAACARQFSDVDIYVHMLPRLKDVNWKVECPNLRDEMCLFDCINPPSTSKSHQRLSGQPNGGTVSPSLSIRHRMQDSRLSPGVAVYSVAKSDFLSTPEHSIHAAVRTGSVQNNSNLKKALHSTMLEPNNRNSGGNSHGLGEPSASISILNESSFFDGKGRQDPQSFEKDSQNATADAQRNLSDAVVDALSTGVSGHANPRTYTYTWQPQGVLISHLAEHKRAVNKLSVSHDNFFLTSASDDGTCKIWDCKRLEKDISFKSRLTYSRQGGRILSCISMMHTRQSVASASSNGSVHMWNVEYATRQGIPEKYTGTTQIGKIATDNSADLADSEGAALALTLCGEHLLCYASEHGTVHAYDHRQGKDAWTLDLNPSHGIVRSMFCESVGQTWMGIASNFGVISLFDLRFLMCAKQWQHPNKKDLHSMISFDDLIADDASDNCRVLISAGEHETAVWNIFEGRCEQIFRNLTENAKAYDSNPVSCSASSSVHNSNLSQVEAETEIIHKHLKSQQIRDMHALHSNQKCSPAQAKSQVPPQQQSSGSGHRAILPLPNGGFLTAGSDKFMRFWHPHRFEYSYCMCGPYSKNSNVNTNSNPVDWIVKAPVYYTKKIYNGISTVEEARHGGGQDVQQQQKEGQGQKESKLKLGLSGSTWCHEDCILDLALIDSQERIVISCSRDGIIKGWK
jgi:phosphoinositide-3-kinase regulatory subunit 4